MLWYKKRTDINTLKKYKQLSLREKYFEDTGHKKATLTTFGFMPLFDALTQQFTRTFDAQMRFYSLKLQVDAKPFSEVNWNKVFEPFVHSWSVWWKFPQNT